MKYKEKLYWSIGVISSFLFCFIMIAVDSGMELRDSEGRDMPFILALFLIALVSATFSAIILSVTVGIRTWWRWLREGDNK